MHTFLAPAWLACAFLARVLRIARASLDRVLSGTRSASLCSYREGSYKAILTVAGLTSLPTTAAGVTREKVIQWRGSLLVVKTT